MYIQYMYGYTYIYVYTEYICTVYTCIYMYIYVRIYFATVSSGSLKVETFAQVSVKWEKQGDQSTLLRFHT